ncbi:uncharacterized protein [Littorina saxatilis]|uniref:uncharacterized protein isoform X3 n=1 Tax=Littorina saxatilis TaxID=31220 RepID=UPI0038B67DBB
MTPGKKHAMASVALVFRLVVCLAVLNHGQYFIATTAAFPAQETCQVLTVTEGEPAVMTFKIRSGIDTASKTFFAHLRRNDRKRTDIVTCDGLKVACDVKDGHPMFQVDNIMEHKLTVHISNMSRELEGTYVLQVFFNGTTEPVSSCTLNIYTQTITTVITDVETEDQNGSNDGIAVLISVPIIIIIIIVVAVIVGIFFWKRVSNILCKRPRDDEPHVESDQGASIVLLLRTVFRASALSSFFITCVKTISQDQCNLTAWIRMITSDPNKCADVVADDICELHMAGLYIRERKIAYKNFLQNTTVKEGKTCK